MTDGEIKKVSSMSLPLPKYVFSIT